MLPWAKETVNSNRPCFTPCRSPPPASGPASWFPPICEAPSWLTWWCKARARSRCCSTWAKATSRMAWTPLPSPGYCAAAAGFNGEGKPDVAVNTGQGVSILLGTGSASAPFAAGQSITLSNAGCLLAADLNGDHIPDLVVPQPDAVDAYLNNGDGTFSLKSSTPGSTGAGAVTVADFNRDGKLDFATTANSLALGNGDGTFQTPVPLMPNPPSNLFADIAAGDLNGDGWPDLVLSSGPENSTIGIYVLLNNQHGGFAQTIINTCPTLFAPGCNPSEIHLADVNGDGNLDLVVGQVLNGGVVVYLSLIGRRKGAVTVAQKDTQRPRFHQADIRNAVPVQVRHHDGAWGVERVRDRLALGESALAVA